jgi:hypothetical protein
MEPNPRYEQNTTCSVPKPSFRMHADIMPDPASIERSIDDDCPSPVLAGQIQLRFSETHSSEDKQFSPIISALKRTQRPKGRDASGSSMESMQSPVLQVVDANLPPAQSRIPSRIATRDSKVTESDASGLAINANTSISFNPHDSTESSTPKVFGRSHPTASSAIDHALGSNDATAGIQLLTPVAGIPDVRDEVQNCPFLQEPAAVQKQQTAQPELHPLFRQASTLCTRVPVFNLPGTQEENEKCQGKNALDHAKTPHVTIAAPCNFVIEQERLSDPMPAHDPRKLLASENSDQLIGTPPYAKFMRHLNGEMVSPLCGEITLMVKQPSPAAACSPAPGPTAQPSFSSAATPDGRNFGDLLSAINAHKYHSPAPAMFAHFAGADMAQSDTVYDTARDAESEEVSPSLPAEGFGDLLSAINAHQYHSPAPAMMSRLADNDAAACDAAYEAASPSVDCKETMVATQCLGDASRSELAPEEVIVQDTTDADIHGVVKAVPQAYAVEIIDPNADQTMDLPVADNPTAPRCSSMELSVAEQLSLHTASLHPVMSPKEDRSTPYFSPECCSESPAAPTQCETLMFSNSHMAEHRSPSQPTEYVVSQLQVIPQRSSSSDPAVVLSLQVFFGGSEEAVSPSCATIAGNHTTLVSSPCMARELDAHSVSSSLGSIPDPSIFPSQPADMTPEQALLISPVQPASSAFAQPASVVPEEPEAITPSWSLLQGKGSTPFSGKVGSCDDVEGDGLRHNHVAFLSESDAEFSFGLSPPSARQESVASVAFGDQHTFSPVLRDDDQTSLCQSVNIPGDQDKVMCNMLSPTKIESPVKTVSPVPRGAHATHILNASNRCKFRYIHSILNFVVTEIFKKDCIPCVYVQFLLTSDGCFF